MLLLICKNKTFSLKALVHDEVPLQCLVPIFGKLYTVPEGQKSGKYRLEYNVKKKKYFMIKKKKKL